MTINSRAKGASGEREWRDVLRSYGHEARRGQQFSGGPDSPDVVCPSLPFHWEVKRTQKLSVYGAFEQAKRDCGDKMPIVAHKRNYSDWLVIMDAHDFMKMVQEEKLNLPE